MTVTILCPKLTCRAVLQVPDNVRGKRVRCGKCETTFLVPQAAVPGKTEPTKKQPAESASN